MLPKRFDQTRPFFVLGMVVLVWLMLPVVIKRAVRVSFFEFQAPVETAASTARDLQDFWALRTRSKNELIEAGQQLARLNSQYEVSIQQNTTLRAEMTRLEELLRLPSFSDYRAEPARVSRRDFNGWWQRIIIKKGRNYEIPVGAPVIFVGGVVGRVSEVGAYTAVVDLISNPTVRIAGSIEGENRPISFQGGLNPTFGPARGFVDFVPLDVSASAQLPRRLVTSGLGGVFPPGLFIGQIVHVELNADGMFKSGEVELDQRLASVSEVTVLVPLKTE